MQTFYPNARMRLDNNGHGEHCAHGHINDAYVMLPQNSKELFVSFFK